MESSICRLHDSSVSGIYQFLTLLLLLLLNTTQHLVLLYLLQQTMDVMQMRCECM